MYGKRTLKATLVDLGWRVHLSPVERRELRAIGILSWIMYRLCPPKKVITVRIRGVRLRIRSGTHDLEVAMTSLGGELDCLRDLLPVDFAGTVIDAGGYIGTSTIALRRIFPRARIVCIEPSSENLQILRWNLRNQTNIEIVQGALTGTGGEVELFDRGTGEWGYSASPISESSRLKTKLIETVPGLRLSDLGLDPKNIGVLKLDIEGGELGILTHDHQDLDQIPIIIAELHDDLVPGCSDAYFSFSTSRQLVATPGEKWLSLSR